MGLLPRLCGMIMNEPDYIHQLYGTAKPRFERQVLMANECADVALVAHANQRVRALAAVVHGNRGHGGKHVTNY